jgi:hypothetical protein
VLSRPCLSAHGLGPRASSRGTYDIATRLGGVRHQFYWSRELRPHGVAHRDSNPFDFWMLMGILAIVTGVFAGCAAVLTVEMLPGAFPSQGLRSGPSSFSSSRWHPRRAPRECSNSTAAPPPQAQPEAPGDAAGRPFRRRVSVSSALARASTSARQPDGSSSTS